MVESYSAFGDAGEDTGLAEILRKNGVTHVYCVGLAFDYCVGSTALRAAAEGFKTFIIKDATRSVAPETEEIMGERLEDAGVLSIKTDELIYGNSNVRYSHGLRQTQQTADFTRSDENVADVYSSATLEQKKVRIEESSNQMAADETRATNMLKTSQRGSMRAASHTAIQGFAIHNKQVCKFEQLFTAVFHQVSPSPCLKKAQ